MQWCNFLFWPPILRGFNLFHILGLVHFMLSIESHIECLFLMAWKSIAKRVVGKFKRYIWRERERVIGKCLMFLMILSTIYLFTYYQRLWTHYINAFEWLIGNLEKLLFSCLVFLHYILQCSARARTIWYVLDLDFHSKNIEICVKENSVL